MVVNAGPPARRSSGGSLRRRRSSGGGKRRRRSSGGAGIGNSSLQTRMQKVALGGLAYGLLVKHVPVPRIPGIGRSGTVALGIYLLKPSSTMLQDLGIAAAAIAGASFGETGTVSGDGDDVLTSD